MNRKSCKGCYYHRRVGGDMWCHFMLDTGIPRGCPADKCTRKTNEPPPDPALFLAAVTGRKASKNGEGEEDLPRGVKTSDEVITKIKGMRADGCSVKEIVDETGVKPSTVSRLLKLKEKPAAAATVTDSGRENIRENISDPIISEPAPDVKRDAEAETLWELIAHKRLERCKIEENLIFLYRAEQELHAKMKKYDEELIAIERELAELEKQKG